MFNGTAVNGQQPIATAQSRLFCCRIAAVMRRRFYAVHIDAGGGVGDFNAEPASDVTAEHAHTDGAPIRLPVSRLHVVKPG